MTSRRPSRRNVWPLVRLLLYVAVAAFIFARGAGKRRNAPAQPPLPVFASSDSSLAIAGLDLAPDLIHHLVQLYQADYPDLKITVQGGGTARALEALANRRATVAFLNRPPSAEEQQYIRSSGQDTLIWFPVALGGMVFLRSAAAPQRPVSVAALRRFVSGRPEPAVSRIYAPDPNLGIYDALEDRLRGGPPPEGRPARTGRDREAPAEMKFLHSEAEVIAAVRADTTAIGLVSSLDLLETPQGIATVAIIDSTGVPSQPTEEAIAFSRYPLHHYVYVACRPQGGIQGSMFVTWLTSDRGQRQIERTGFLPARQPLREIHLTRNPVGGSRGGTR